MEIAEFSKRFGKELKAARFAATWSARDVADNSNALITDHARSMDFRQIVSFEMGKMLPTFQQAELLAQVLGLSMLKLFGVAPTPKGTKGWRSGQGRVESLSSLSEVLESKGYDSTLAQSFLAQGQTRNSLRNWLKDFAPEEALDWIRAGVGKIAAMDFVSQGITPSVASVLRNLNMPPSQVGALKELERLHVPDLVVGTWIRTGAPTAVAASCLAQGWDLLAALSWIDTSLGTEGGLAWFSAGFNPPEADERAAKKWTPEEAAYFTKRGLPLADWQRDELDWEGIEPAMVARWKGVGFSAEEARKWEPISPERARRLKDKNMSAEEAHSRDEEGRKRIAGLEDPPQAPASPEDPTKNGGGGGVGSSGPVIEACGHVLDSHGQCECTK
jgi:transcriptional regulator with XRE-family HTH domain